MAGYVSFSSLPGEAIVHIFIYLSPRDIRKCQQVCSLFRNEIRASSPLQYLLELDTAGYSVPTNPRLDLSYEEKIKIIKQSYDNSAASNPAPTPIDLGPTETPITSCQFARGVFTQGQPNLDVTRSLRVYQLPSINKNTLYESWEIPDLHVDAHSYRIDPDLDLLVLLHVDSAPGDPNTDLVRTFYIRSLRSGEPHPLARVPIITSTDKFTSTFFPDAFQIVGKYVALLSHTNQLLSADSPRISVWDWTTGELVTFADVIGKSFSFVSGSCFVVASDRRKYTKELIGSLEVYQFDVATTARRAHHVASLHLPTTPNDPSHSSITFVFSPHSPHSFGTAQFSSSSMPPRVYDLSPNLQYICMRIRAFNIQSYPNGLTRGSLLIPVSSILDALAGLPLHGPQTHVPWEKWALGVYWVNEQLAYFQPENYLFGRRVAQLILNPDTDVFQIAVYRLGSSSGTKTEDPFVTKLATMQSAHQYLDKVFMGSGHAQHPHLVSLITVPSDVLEVTQERPDMMLDDEHVTIYKIPRSQETTHRLHVYSV